MSKFSSETIPTEVHNSPLVYSTISHEKNILVKNKGQHIQSLQKPLSMSYVPECTLTSKRDTHIRSIRKFVGKVRDNSFMLG